MKGPDGSFTKFHLPLEWSDGKATSKAKWGTTLLDRFEQNILDIVGDNSTLSGNSVDAAQLQGVVFPKSFPMPATNYDTIFSLVLDDSYIAGHINADRNIFSPKTRMNNCLILDYVDFSKAEFQGDIEVDNSIFMSRLDFTDCNIFGKFSARNCLIFGETHISSANFKQEASFMDSEFYKILDAFNAKFCQDTWFSGCKFHEEAAFVKSNFLDHANFFQCKFFQRATFVNCRFEGDVNFRLSEYNSKLNYSYSKFCRQANFSDIDVPKSASTYTSAFRGSHFDGWSDFSKERFSEFAILSDATFEVPPLVADIGTDSDRLFFRAVKAAESTALSLWESEATENQRENSLDPLRDNFLRAIEKGCRNIKHSHEVARARASEQTFYRFEMMARLRRPSVPLWEKISSASYDILGGYGGTVLKPITWLIITTGVSAIIYWTMSEMFTQQMTGALYHDSNVVLENLVQSGGLSVRNTLRPFSIWENFSDASQPWLRSFLDDTPIWARVTVRVVSTGQSFLAIVLTFLAALSLRRRYQIN